MINKMCNKCSNQNSYHDQAKVLDNKRRKLEASDDTIGVGVIHIFVINHNIVLGRHVISNVMIDDKSENSI